MRHSASMSYEIPYLYIWSMNYMTAHTGLDFSNVYGMTCPLTRVQKVFCLHPVDGDASYICGDGVFSSFLFENILMGWQITIRCAADNQNISRSSQWVRTGLCAKLFVRHCMFCKKISITFTQNEDGLLMCFKIEKKYRTFPHNISILTKHFFYRI